MLDTYRLPLFAYIALWLAVRHTTAKNDGSYSFLELVKSELEMHRAIIRFFDMRTSNGKIAGYIRHKLVSYSNKRIDLLATWMASVPFDVTINFIRFDNKN